MSKYLRHTKTGDIMICTPQLMSRSDMVEISDDDALAMIKQNTRPQKPQQAAAGKTPPTLEDSVPPPKKKRTKKAAEPVAEEPITDPGVDNSAGDVAAALLGGDE